MAAANLKDPRERGPKPPFPQQAIARAGKEAQMHPEPDHGESAYRRSCPKLDDIPLDEIQKTFQTNVSPVFYLTQAASPNLRPGACFINTSSIAPGPVWTPLIPSTLDPDFVSKFGSHTAFGRPAQPVGQATLCVFLASDDASYVTGEVFGATGGHTPI
jgi:NAD(P)-dependent dehydrogenase (short-subunit alcohol dehydrogenase family)